MHTCAAHDSLSNTQQRYVPQCFSFTLFIHLITNVLPAPREGTARTCTFIALDTLQRYVLQHALGEKVDVFTVLLNIIKCRPHMMQSEVGAINIHTMQSDFDI